MLTALRIGDCCFVEVLLLSFSEPNYLLAIMPKENIGYGSALGYFYGYLRLVLPGIIIICMPFRISA
jgi:hypothetical protein